ncbi:centromere protein K isoform X1 [Osmerus mordax]|uniref:centromere protein K isoform X1 n=1 Tax=Osmerus mordax TaxID=8014 RepID=UPI00350FFC02
MAQVQPNDNEANVPDLTEFSEAVQTEELLNECEEKFAQLQMLQNKIILSETDSCDSPQEQSVNRLTTIAAEMIQWQKVEPKLLSKNPEVLHALGKQELQKLNAQLEMVLSCAQEKRNKLRDTLKSEQKWLEEKKEVLAAATDHVTRLKLENEQQSEQIVLQETKKKIQKMKDYQDRLLETLGDVLEEHFPLPQNETPANKKKKNIPQELKSNLISLNEILELLMNKTLETPHDPYVTVDDTFWPPYMEILLRYDIATRHPEDCFKIRLETFY